MKNKIFLYSCIANQVLLNNDIIKRLAIFELETVTDVSIFTHDIQSFFLVKTEDDIMNNSLINAILQHNIPILSNNMNNSYGNSYTYCDTDDLFNKIVALIPKQKNILYLTALTNNGTNYNNICENIHISKYLCKHADIKNFKYLSMFSVTQYDLIIISAIVFVPMLAKFDWKDLSSTYKCLLDAKKVVILLHDLHENSLFVLNKNECASNFLNGKFQPILNDSIAKQNMFKLFTATNIKYAISIYDCPEYDFFRSYYTNINKFYIMNHAYPRDVFKKLNIDKIYDVLFYGSRFEKIYPFRKRLLYICKTMDLKIKILESKPNFYDPTIYDHELNKYINQSWMCIACLSNYSYFVRKYLEISAGNSIVLGNINIQGKRILGENIVNVDDSMSNDEIINKIQYFLNNKLLLLEKYENIKNIIKNHTYENYVINLINIANNIINNDNIEFPLLYENYIINSTNVIDNVIDNKNITISPIDISENFTDKNKPMNSNNKIHHTTDNKNLVTNITDTTDNTVDNNNIVTNIVDKIDNIIDSIEFNNIYQIKQISIASYLSDNFAANIYKYKKLDKYNNKNKPSFFYGMMRNKEINIFENNTAIKIIIWNRDDLNTNTKLTINNMEYFKNKKTIYHIAISSFIQNKLNICQIPYITIPIIDHNSTNTVRKYIEPRNDFFDISFYKNNINNYFDKVFVINLEKDNTKWDFIVKKLKENDINNYERFSAVNGYEEPYLSQWNLYSNTEFNNFEKNLGRKQIRNPGVLGMIYSFMSVLKISKNRKYSKILYLEDDVIFSKDFNHKFRECVSSLSEWKLLYLGATTYNISNISINSVSDKYFRPDYRYTDGGFAVGIDASVYDILLEECSKVYLPPDSGALRHVIRNYNNQTYIAYPNLIIANLSEDKTKIDDTMKKQCEVKGWDLSLYDISSFKSVTNKQYC